MVAGAVNVAGSSASFHTSAGDSHIGGQALKGDAAHSECSSDQERTILIHHPLCELHDIPGEYLSACVSSPLPRNARFNRRRYHHGRDRIAVPVFAHGSFHFTKRESEKR